MTSQRRIFGLATVIFLVLAGCGQNGPLFLPEETAPAAEAPAASTPAAETGEAAPRQNDGDDEER